MSQDDMLDSVVDSADDGGSSSQPKKSPSLGDDWYLLSSQALEERKAPAEKEPAASNSKRPIIAAALAALLIGAAAAWFVFNFGHAGRRAPGHATQDVSTAPALSKREAAPVKALPILPAQTSTSRAVPATNDDELARLRKENRRLVALVEVLRRRSRTNQDCSAAEQSGTTKE